MKSLLVLGSTGSIGTQALEVVRAHPGAFRIEGLSARSSWERLLAQVREFRPRVVALADRAAAERIAPELPRGTALLAGDEALQQITAEADYQTCVHGVVGGAGLVASVGVLERGLDLALANKESLVMAGAALMDLAARRGGKILPVDSELCAIHQCLLGEDVETVRRIHLTASGGPLRDTPLEEMERATPSMALAHPNWDMGPRITIGSATLMNKALEVIEVHHLFGVPREKIHVVIHRQSIVHSLVEFVDGSVKAQLGPPDMRAPLAYCLFRPARVASDLVGFDLELFRNLTFEEPDPRRFPALELGFRCIEEGSDAGSVLNAADEVAVDAFLQSRIRFGDIGRVNARVLDRRPGFGSGVEDLLAADRLARGLARAEIEGLRAAT